jgi:hypothetical protein
VATAPRLATLVLSAAGDPEGRSYGIDGLLVQKEVLMPLDARKEQHMLQVIPRTFAGRQRTVVIVYLAGGSYSYSAVQVIMRPEQIIDPQIYDASGMAPLHNADMLMIAPPGTNFTGAVYIADTTTATAAAVASAPKYEIIEALPVGMVVGGTHLRVLLRRMR